MGQPLSAPLANIFLCYHEQKWLEEWPEEIRPVFYKRYVDDTYIILKHKDHVQLFYEYLNTKHRNIKFTKEEETNKTLLFLDILIERKQNRINTTVYRKGTFTGVGLNFLSHVYSKYKTELFFYLICQSLEKHYELLRFSLRNWVPKNIFYQ